MHWNPKGCAGAITWAVATLLALVCLPAPAGAAFDDIEVSPRARALGGAWAALGGDEYAALHNPAALAWAGRGCGSASYLRPFGYDFSSQSAAAMTASLPGRAGGIGLALRRFGVEYLGEQLTTETTVALGHGFRILADSQSELAVGWSLNLYALEFGRSVTGLDPGSARGLGVNLGAQAVVRERTRVGFYALNVNNPHLGRRDKEELRRSVLAGVSYAPYPGVETVLGLSNDLGQPVQWRGGTEFEVTDYLRLRAGLATEPNAFTAGVGFSRAGLRIDYAFSTGGGVLAETHQFGVGYVLGGGR